MALIRTLFLRGSLVAFLCCPAAEAAAAATISNAGWSQTQFNPAIGARATLVFSLTESARVSVRVVDLNGGSIRALASRMVFDAGDHALAWDGRDDDGRIVPDGAYQPVVEAAKRRARAVPATTPTDGTSVIPVRYYDRRTGTIAYDLPSPSVVRVIANAQTTDGGSASRLVTAAAVRPAGSVIEPWDGLDQSGTTRIPDLPGFTIRIEASPLPADAVIVYGARAAVSGAGSATEAASGRVLAPLEPKGDR